jgi:hypothetical protein
MSRSWSSGSGMTWILFSGILGSMDRLELSVHPSVKSTWILEAKLAWHMCFQNTTLITLRTESKKCLPLYDSRWQPQRWKCNTQRLPLKQDSL